MEIHEIHENFRVSPRLVKYYSIWPDILYIYIFNRGSSVPMCSSSPPGRWNYKSIIWPRPLAVLRILGGGNRKTWWLGFKYYVMFTGNDPIWLYNLFQWFFLLLGLFLFGVCLFCYRLCAIKSWGLLNGLVNIRGYTPTRGWFQTFFIFTPTWGNDPIWLICFNCFFFWFVVWCFCVTSWNQPSKKQKF